MTDQTSFTTRSRRDALDERHIQAAAAESYALNQASESARRTADEKAAHELALGLR